jgi:hypothetical protein
MNVRMSVEHAMSVEHLSKMVPRSGALRTASGAAEDADGRTHPFWDSTRGLAEFGPSGGVAA